MNRISGLLPRGDYGVTRLIGLLLAISSFVSCADAQVPTRESKREAKPWDAAEKQFQVERFTARNTVLTALATAAKTEDPDLQARVAADREAFLERALLPACAPAAARSYELAMAGAVKRLLDSYAAEAMRYRRQSRDEDATRIERERERREQDLRHSRERDLRSQLDLGQAAPKGGWSWSGAALVSAPHATGSLRLFATGGFPTNYELTLRLVQPPDSTGSQLLFPYEFNGRRLLGMITLGAGSVTLHALHAKDAEKTHEIGDSADIQRGITVVVQKGSVQVMLGEREVLVADLGNLAPLPEEAAKAVVDPVVPWLFPAEGAHLRLLDLRLLTRDPRTEAGAAGGPVTGAVMAKGAQLGGKWDGSSPQDGICRSIEVISRDGKKAVIEVATNGGDVFRFHVEIVGKRLTIKDIVHTDAPRRRPIMGLSEVTGSGYMTGTGFQFTFEAHRSLPRKTDVWTGRITAKSPPSTSPNR